MKAALTVRLDEEMERALDRVCESTGKSRSDIVREAIRRQVALMEFEQIRSMVMPYAEAQGYLTDEDVFRDIS